MNPAEPRSIDVGGQRLDFHLRRSNRRTIAISVEPDQRVVVTAPLSTPEERIAAAVLRRARWIRRQQRTFKDMPPRVPARRWVAGETHRYLGRQYRLKLVAAEIPSVRLSGAFFVVSAPAPRSADTVSMLVNRWYREHAKLVLAERVERILKSTGWVRLQETPSLTVLTMRQRWGSATPSGRLYFNADLIKVPLGCIDYVVAHELAHLKFPHHGPAFWRLLGRMMPDWARWRRKLERQEI